MGLILVFTIFIVWYTSLLKNCWLSEGGYANFCKWCQVMCFEGDGDTNAAAPLSLWQDWQDMGDASPRIGFIMYPHLSSLCYHSGKVTVLGIGDHPKIFQTSLLIIRQERTERERQIFHHSEARTGGHTSRVKLIVWVGLFQRKGLLNRLIHVDPTFDMNHGCLLPATWGYTRTGMSIDASVHVFAFMYTVDIYI